jgi:hypothetical protein
MKCAGTATQNNSWRYIVDRESTVDVTDRLNSANVTFYVFEDNAAYQAYFNGHGGTTPQNFAGKHGGSVTNTALPYTVVF